MFHFNKSVTIKVSRIDERAELPRKSHDSMFADAAYDLFSFAADPCDPTDIYDNSLLTEETAYVESILRTSFSYPKVTPSKFTLESGERKLVGTGIRLAIPNGYWVKFHERSGMANKGIHILGGVIDAGYTGELKVIMYNSGSDLYEHDCSKAICQFTVEKVTDSKLELISEDDMAQEAMLRERKDKGFGSSDGTK